MVYTANHPEQGLTPPDNDNKSFREIEKEIVLNRLWDDFIYYCDLLNEKKYEHRHIAINRLLDYIRKKIETIENN